MTRARLPCRPAVKLGPYGLHHRATAMAAAPSFPSPSDPFTLGLVAAIAVARALDFLSTWLVTPTLALEANPLMRRMRWGWMTATILN